MQKHIAIFILDQLSWRALPAYGNEFIETPNIDRITKDSLRIDGCYTSCPLCQPARASFWTGRYPHETGVLSNGKKWPENFTFEDIENRPAAVRYICCTNNRQAQAAGWTPENFREYLRAYYYYLSLADASVGRVLDSLEKRGYNQENTLFVFLSDHGDSMAAHGLVTKQVNFYEEITRVPMVFQGLGVQSGKREGIASLLDLFPTLCSWAGISAPDGLRGKDLTAAFAGGDLPERDYVACEWHTEWGYTVSPGRMIRTERYKYTRYIEDGGEEFFDLEKDPMEKRNLVKDSGYGGVLEEMRGFLHQQEELTGDSFEILSWKADKRWRSHLSGYQNHSGIAALMAEN